MASALTHLRIIEHLLEYGFQVPAIPFACGCLAPNADVTGRARAHYYDRNQYIQPEVFFDEYVAGRELALEQYAFLLGYYVHLVADLEWYAQVVQPNSHRQDIRNQEAVADQIALDRQFLLAHPDHLLVSVLNSPPISYPPADHVLLERMMAELRSVYADVQLRQAAEESLARNLTAFDVDAYVECTTRGLIELLHSKAVDCPTPRLPSAFDIRTVS
jgi:hypothetical protein